MHGVEVHLGSFTSFCFYLRLPTPKALAQNLIFLKLLQRAWGNDNQMCGGFRRGSSLGGTMANRATQAPKGQLQPSSRQCQPYPVDTVSRTGFADEMRCFRSRER